MSSLRDYIGGRWAVSWQGFLLGYPFAVLFVFVGSPSIWQSDSTFIGIAIGLGASTAFYAGVGVVLWLASISVFRNRQQVSVPVVLVTVVGGFAWMFRAALIIGYLDWQNLPAELPPGRQLFAGFVQGAIGIPLTAWVIASVSDFYDRRRNLLEELAAEEGQAVGVAIGIEAMRAEVIRNVRRSLNDSLSELPLPPPEEAVTTQDLDALREVSRKTSRDLADDLWTSAERNSRVNPLALIRTTATHRPFAYWGLIPIVVLGALARPGSWPTHVTWMGLGTMAVLAMGVSITANHFAPRLKSRVAVAAYGCEVMVLIAIGLVVQDVVGLMGVSTDDRSLWLVVIGLGFFYPLVGLGASIGRAQREVLNRLRDTISATEIRSAMLRREDAQIRRDLAMLLHGGWQADLTAASMRVQQAIDCGDQVAAHEALDLAIRLVDRDIEEPSERSASVESLVAGLVDSWAGLVVIDAVVTGHGWQAPNRTRLIREVTVEGVNNAVRHADAQRIDLVIHFDGNRTAIAIADDGDGPGSGARGVGSKMLNHVAPGSWSLEKLVGGGSRLTVILEHGEQPSHSASQDERPAFE